MAKKPNRSLKLDECFGTLHSYRIFALKSELSAFPFANQLGKAENTTFTILPDLEYSSKKYTAHFTVFYAEYKKEDSIHCLLLENKTTNFNQGELFVPKSEKKLSFQTISLFEEYFYLFNKQGLKFFPVDFSDIDYLLLVYTKKEIENEIFKSFVSRLEPFIMSDVSDMLQNEQTSLDKKIMKFLKDFFGRYEVLANKFSRRKRLDLLAPVKQIPKQNQKYPIPAFLEQIPVTNFISMSD